jgi:hypothetical protein
MGEVGLGRCSIAITACCFDGRSASDGLVRVGQGLDRRPNAIDQHVPITELLLLLDTGKRIPQPQRRLLLSRAACNSSIEATAISPLSMLDGGLRQSVIPSLPMM